MKKTMSILKISIGKWFIAAVLLYIVGLTGYSIFTYNKTKELLIKSIDKKLEIAARSLKYMIATDFHDRAMDEKSISWEEELHNRKNISGYANETELEYVHTVVEKEGFFYFSAPTVTAAEAMEKDKWYFHPYEDIPKEFVQAYNTGEKVFLTYKDQWGAFRSIALPQKSPAGKTYLACADYNVDYIETLLWKEIKGTVYLGIFLLSLTLPFILLYRSYGQVLVKLNKDLQFHKNNLEEIVTLRTAALKEAQKELREQAMKDFLTGVYSRRYIMERLYQEVSHSARKEIPFSLMFIDIDNFKIYNDTKGHLNGDHLLVKLAQLMKDSTRNEDIVGRFGGDEFIIILPGTDIQSALNAAERLQKNLREYCMSSSLPVSISIGLLSHEDGTAEELLEKADKLLYQAKEKGGNTIVVKAGVSISQISHSAAIEKNG